MRSTALSLFAALLLLVSPGNALAQYCLGQPSFTTTRAQIGGALQTGNDAFGYSAQASFGNASGVFAGFNVGGVKYDILDGSSLGFGVTAGMDMLNDESSALSVCPIISASFGFGPNDIFGLGVDHKSSAFSGGIALGGVMARTESMEIAPMISGQVVHGTSKFSDGTDSVSESDTYGVLTLGIGLIAQKVFSFTPFVGIPLGLDGADPEFGLRFGVSMLR
ncbi:MAG TPA: hypothetical protein VKZ41_07140 [Gemmatimonadales bacterium]|nr:hypothetical protein [Gemmatimonadales bacterium]